MWTTTKTRKARNAKSTFQIHCNMNSKYQIVSVFPENRLSPLAYSDGHFQYTANPWSAVQCTV